jgi:hypothetical protein
MMPYPKKKDTPSRLSRKQARKTVFMTNAKARKLEKKARRAANRETE